MGDYSCSSALPTHTAPLVPSCILPLCGSVVNGLQFAKQHSQESQSEKPHSESVCVGSVKTLREQSGAGLCLWEELVCSRSPGVEGSVPSCSGPQPLSSPLQPRYQAVLCSS
ncbi:Mitochondrial Import Receptor Subunit Tom40 [Manis pentadactyla]|nr:Mitochondrial Import Receptor Subunit Tom40 [Manis pentadactyla]